MAFIGHGNLIKMGMERSRKAGVVIGRPKLVDVEPIKALRAQGLSMRNIAKQLGISPASVCMALKGDSNE
jgi:DNA-binding CsgD family transcriptional regulator